MSIAPDRREVPEKLQTMMVWNTHGRYAPLSSEGIPRGEGRKWGWLLGVTPSTIGGWVSRKSTPIPEDREKINILYRIWKQTSVDDEALALWKEIWNKVEYWGQPRSPLDEGLLGLFKMMGYRWLIEDCYNESIRQRANTATR